MSGEATSSACRRAAAGPVAADQDPEAPLHPPALAHHRVAERDRCWRWRVRGRPVFVCARCLGMALGFLPTLALYATGALDLLGRTPELFVVLLPLPGVVDWCLGRLGRLDSGNAARTASGVLLGAAQAAAYWLFLTAPGSVWLWGAACCYVAAVGTVELAARPRALENGPRCDGAGRAPRC